MYNLHVPLDNFGEYSTSVWLARQLGIQVTRPFYEYYGALAAVFGKTGLTDLKVLSDRFESLVGHRTSLYQYGTSEVRNGSVAVAAGGGNDVGVLEEVAGAGINTFVTGITVKNEHSEKAHEFAQKNAINILGGTHYSTEKPACQAMCNYFIELGLPSEFIDDNPILQDL